MEKKMTKKKVNRKQYGHIAVGERLKKKFEILRYQEIGERMRDITQEDLLVILMKSYKNRKKDKVANPLKQHGKK